MLFNFFECGRKGLQAFVRARLLKLKHLHKERQVILVIRELTRGLNMLVPFGHVTLANFAFTLVNWSILTGSRLLILGHLFADEDENALILIFT